MADSKQTFPTLPVTHWFNLRNQLKKSIPGTISTNYIASVFGMSESSARTNVIPSLRQIGLLDSEGKTNQELAKKLRDDSSYPDFCAAVLKKVYPQELRDAFPDNDSNKDKIKFWFMNHTGVGDSAASRMATFYSTMLEADPNSQKGPSAKSNIVKGKTTPFRNPLPQKKPASSPNKSESKTQAFVPTEAAIQKNRIGPEVNINIQIHISSDASPDQIKSIFENMAKYIYKN